MYDLVKTWVSKRKVIIAVATIIMFLIIIFLLVFSLFSKKQTSDQTSESLANYYMSQNSELQISTSLDETSNLSVESEKEISEYIFVDVKGAVRIPGVYEIISDTRLTEVIALAGGFLSTADQSVVNLSQKLTDQMMITIPTLGAEKDSINANKSEQELPSVISKPDEISDVEVGRLNLNTADSTQLQTLPGIGEKKAEGILQYRQEQGSYKTIEELKEVSGIGDKTFEALADFISVGRD